MILAVGALVVGGVVYAGVSTVRKHQRKKDFLWLTKQNTESANLFRQQGVDLVELEKSINRNFTISSFSLGVAVTGSLVYPPLMAITIPLTIYDASPLFKEAYEALFYHGQTKTAIISSVVIIGTLTTNHYVIAALITWGYRLNHKLLLELNYSYRKLLSQLFGAESRSIWILVDDLEVKIPRYEIQVGDIVVVNEGEIIPFDGTIRQGSAFIDLYILTGQARPIEKEVGDAVFAATNLVSGRICFQIKKI